MDLLTIQEDMPISQRDEIVNNLPSAAPDINKDAIVELEKHLLTQLSISFNKKLQVFFENEFDTKLDNIVEVKLNEMTLDSTFNNKSLLNQTLGKSDNCNADLETRVSCVEDEMKRLQEELTEKNKKLAEMNAQNNELLLRIQVTDCHNGDSSSDSASHPNVVGDVSTPAKPQPLPIVQAIQESLENVQLDTAAAQADIVELKKFEKELDRLKLEVLDRDKNEATETSKLLLEVDEKIKSLCECQETMKILYDELEQYGRRDILEFWGIWQSKGEDTTYLVLDFLDSVLGLKLSAHDISVSHRQRQPQSKNKWQGNPDPIYVKLVNRSTKNKILYLKKKHFKRMKQTNVHIVENLTKQRRELFAQAKEKLSNFQFIWVKEGNVFARKYSTSKVYKITNFDIIAKLS